MEPRRKFRRQSRLDSSGRVWIAPGNIGAVRDAQGQPLHGPLRAQEVGSVWAVRTTHLAEPIRQGSGLVADQGPLGRLLCWLGLHDTVVHGHSARIRGDQGWVTYERLRLMCVRCEETREVET